MTRIPRILLALLLLAVATTGFVLGGRVPPGAAASPALSVPAPTGDRPVGAAELHLADRTRQDPWAPDARPREVGVTVYYPARAAGRTPAPYLDPAESAAYLDFQQEQAPELAQLPRDLLSGVEVPATTDATPRRGRHPLVLVSPGFSLPSATLTALATDLASRGYVVAALDHPYESSGTTLADGTLATCAACEETASLQTSHRHSRSARDRAGVRSRYAAVPRVRARDTRFVLDRLLARGSRWRPLIDARRIGMAGHSIGGNAAAVAGRRVRAAVDLDGTLFEPVTDRRRPLLLLGTQELHRPGGEDESWDRTWRRHRGPGAWFTVEGANHGSFTDVPALAAQLGLRDDALDGKRAIAITRRVTAAFLDRRLRHRATRLPRFPELRRERGRI